MPTYTIPTHKKWYEVDRMVAKINERKRKGARPCLTNLDNYINYHFNRNPTTNA